MNKKKFNIKRYIWIIILTTMYILFVIDWSYGRVVHSWSFLLVVAFGSFIGRLLDGLVIGFFIWIARVKILKKDAWPMYKFLNVVAYSAVLTKIILEILKKV